MQSRTALHPRTQRGAIMVVSLLLLLVMTVLALTASQTTTLQERMAGNARDTDLAFQAGEAGLRDAEAQLTASIIAEGTIPARCPQSDPCPLKEHNINFRPDYARGDSFWSQITRQYGGDEKQIAEVVSDPLINTELRALLPDSWSDSKAGAPSGLAYFTHVVKAKGGTDTATAVLQTVTAERYPR